MSTITPTSALTPSDGYAYEGQELEICASARNWKSYYASHIRPYMRGHILEVGAGLGGTAPALCDSGLRAWTALEPDAALASEMTARLINAPLPATWNCVVGTVEDLPAKPTYDTAIYIDVLEHIEDDRDELARVALRLMPGGRVIVLSPAHDSLFTAFDKAIGHCRRYDKTSLAAVTPNSMSLERMFYLDSVGMLASLGNRWLLHSAQPSAAQIRFWDRFLIPASRFADPLTRLRVGKTIIGIWKRI